jgi:hypothetical protein
MKHKDWEPDLKEIVGFVAGFYFWLVIAELLDITSGCTYLSIYSRNPTRNRPPETKTNLNSSIFELC